MNVFPNDTDKPKQDSEDVSRSPDEQKQEQTDPNLTELKGLTDPNEDLEPKGTDNDV
jgi:hypothetical protein